MTEKQKAGASATPSATAVKAPKETPINALNWLIHLLYIRKDFKQCMEIIDEQLTATNGMNEYAIYVKAMIMRQEGRIQDSMEQFQACAVISPTNVLNLKQVARSL